MAQHNYDVIVVGAGNAAFAAAVSAQQKGAKVLVLECAPEDEAGGNSRYTAGAIRFAFNGVDDVRAVCPDITDEEAAAASMLGGLCASGWHTGSVMISLLSRYFHREIERAKREGRPSAAFGPSPGFDDLKWIRPVFPDDTIRFAGKIVAKRESQSRPQWGLVSIEATGTNQKDEPVFSFVGHVFVPRGNPG